MIHPPLGLWDVSGLTWGDVAWPAALFVGTFLASIVVVAVVLVRMPATYFIDTRPRGERDDRHPVFRWTVRVLRNLLGLVLVGVGLLMLVTPGQGVLTILMGVMLLEFPGKRRLIRALIARPSVVPAINRLRARFGKTPIVLGEEPAPSVSSP